MTAAPCGLPAGEAVRHPERACPAPGTADGKSGPDTAQDGRTFPARPPKAVRDIDRSAVRLWDPDAPQHVWLDDAADVIASETGLRAVAAGVPCMVHSMGSMIGAGFRWTTVVSLPDRIPILSFQEHADIVSGDGARFRKACTNVIAHIKAHPALYFKQDLTEKGESHA